MYFIIFFLITVLIYLRKLFYLFQDLPDWFVKEEEYHMRKRPDVDPEVVAYYKERARDMNTKTIKKVVEAKARSEISELFYHW